MILFFNIFKINRSHQSQAILTILCFYSNKKSYKLFSYCISDLILNENQNSEILFEIIQNFVLQPNIAYCIKF